jgi:hypothetical protein
MMQRTILLAALGLATLGWSQEPPAAAPTLKEEAIFIEYCATTGEAALNVEAESESVLRNVLVRNAAGARILKLQTRAGSGVNLSGFKVESYESRLEPLLAAAPEGRYDMFAGTSDGRVATGAAQLSHLLPAAPTITYPLEGMSGVPLAKLTITWTADPSAAAYRVGLEQGDTDGLRALMPAGSNSLEIPAGVLQPDLDTWLEVSAIGENGNMTTVQLEFTAL